MILKPFLALLFLTSVYTITSALRLPLKQAGELKGTWERTNGDRTEVALFTDGYCSFTAYEKNGKKFLYTQGGPFEATKGKLTVSLEYNSVEPQLTGTKLTILYNIEKAALITQKDGMVQEWRRIDNGMASLAGNWRIIKRMQDGHLQTIHQTGTRKTVKLLTGTRFQWVAIDPGVKGFYGTGGGVYTFENGSYTEHIGFFSRDSSRVGASLSFIGKLENGDWHHSGKSSKGDPIYEVWSRK